MSAIEEALREMGVRGEMLDIKELLPPNLEKFEDDLGKEGLKKVFQSLVYVYIAQDIYRVSGSPGRYGFGPEYRPEYPGICKSEENCYDCEKLIDYMVNRFKLFQTWPWDEISLISTTAVGSKLAESILTAKINNMRFEDIFPGYLNEEKVILKLLKKSRIIPIKAPSKLIEQLDSELLYVEEVQKLLSHFCEMTGEEDNGSGTVKVHYYVKSTSCKSGDEGLYYIVSNELLRKLKKDIDGRGMDTEFDKKIDEIENKLLALRFLEKFRNDESKACELLKNQSVERDTVIKYLEFLREKKNKIVNVGKGDINPCDFIITNDEGYHQQIEELRRELYKELKRSIWESDSEGEVNLELEHEQKAQDVLPVTKSEEKSKKKELFEKPVTKNMNKVLVGFECGTGERVEIKPAHLFISGVTQKSGKTTTLEALINRSSFTAISFLTKPGEESFKDAHPCLPFFSEDIEWKTLEGLFQSLLGGERMKSLRPRLIRLCNMEKKLSAVKKKIDDELKKDKLKHEDDFILMQAYIEDVFKQLESVKYTSKLELERGINVMDLKNVGEELQSYIINSVLKEILNNENRRNTIVIIPEAWKFVPQSAGSACKKSIEELIRQGANRNNFLWLDAQDITGVDKTILKSVSTWLLGLQTEKNEVKHTIEQLPLSKKQKPTTEIIMTLGLGEFFVSEGKQVRKTYVMPKWMSEQEAQEEAKNRDPWKP